MFLSGSETCSTHKISNNHHFSRHFNFTLFPSSYWDRADFSIPRNLIMPWPKNGGRINGEEREGEKGRGRSPQPPLFGVKSRQQWIQRCALIKGHSDRMWWRIRVDFDAILGSQGPPSLCESKGLSDYSDGVFIRTRPGAERWGGCGRRRFMWLVLNTR